MIRTMTFNIGNSFKYIFRRDNKENTIQDIKKAIWYVNDELKKRRGWRYTIMAPLLQPLYYLGRQDMFTAYNKRSKLINRINVCESDTIAACVYRLLHEADVYFWRTEELEDAKMLISALLRY